MSQPCLPVPRRRKRDDDKDSKEVGFDDIQSIDADEYLARVVRQASNLPEFVEAAGEEQEDEQGIAKRRRHIPIDGSAASLAYLVSRRASLTRPPSDEYLPRNRFGSKRQELILGIFEFIWKSVRMKELVERRRREFPCRR